MRLRRRGFNLLAALAALPLRGKADPAAPLQDVWATLTVAARHLFPHAQLADTHYGVIAESFVTTNEPQAQRLANVLGKLRFGALSPTERLETMRGIQHTADFQTFRMHTLTHLYGNLEVTRAFGYEGPSLPKGGYLERGFDAISWLPDGD